MAFWLRYFDNFYEAVSSQWHVTEIEIAKPWMAEYDVVVDAFLVWYDWRAKEKSKETRTQRESHEANVPRASDHAQTFRGAH
jgi:hypothetical protein